MSFTPEELRLLRLSDVADGYRPTHSPRSKRVHGRIGRQPLPLTDEQRVAALELRAAGKSWHVIGRLLHVGDRRLERELGRESA